MEVINYICSKSEVLSKGKRRPPVATQRFEIRMQTSGLVKILTETGSRQHPCHQVRRHAVWENRLQDVAGESEGDNCKCGGIHDEHGTPK